MWNLRGKVNRKRVFQPVPVAFPVEKPPLIGLTTLYLTGLATDVKGGDNLFAMLVPGQFKHGTLWLRLSDGDAMTLRLIVNDAQLQETVVSGGLNRIDVEFGLSEGDRVAVAVAEKPGDAVWWGLQLNQGMI